MNQHFVQFYESDGFLVDEVTDFIGNGLKAGEAGIVIASKAHREALQPRLSAHLNRGQSLSAKWKASKRPRQAGPYIALDADETLSRFMIDGWPDEQRFRDLIGGVIAKGALAGNGKVRAFGEMVALLWEAGQRDAAIRVEDLWNELAKRQSFSLFCAYPMRAFSSADDGKRLLAVCSAHSHVHPAETVTASMNPEQLNRVIVQLQHKAAALEAEVRKRTQLEKSLKSREAELSDFLAMLGHELRDPLAPIFNALELMKVAGKDERRMQEARGIVERQTAMLKRIVDDLLDISRLTHGRIELQREKAQLDAVVQRAVEMAQPLIDEKGHRLTVNLPAGPLPLLIDPLRLRQVLANLLTNAAKYTNPGGLIVLAARKEGSELILSVRDNGIGLESELLEQAFDLFAQGRDSLGLGIGLTLVRKIVELHGGRVYARSQGPGHGSEFVIHLPLPPSGASQKILVVDDNTDAAETLAECLRFLNHEVRTAHDATSAIEQALLESPDLVILDIGLPGMDGYEVARRLRTLPQMKSTVLVALTGYAQEGDIALAAQCGLDHHLSKPLDLPQLTALLETRRRPKPRSASSRVPHNNLH